MSKITDALRRAEAEGAVIRSAFYNARQTGSPGRVISGFSASVAVFSPASPKASAPEAVSESLKSWEQAMALAGKQLESYERQIAEQAGEQARLDEKLQTVEQMLANAERERKEIIIAQEQQAQRKASLEKTRTIWARQLEALRECAVLSQACRDAENELKANAECIDRSIALEKRAAEERSLYEQQETVIRGKVEALRFKLASALSSTGTTDVHEGVA